MVLPEDKRVAGDIKERVSNRLKVSSIWIKKDMSREILNYYYSVGNCTWLSDKDRILQSSNDWLYKFMQHYNFTKKKISNKKVKKLEESRVRYQHFHSYFHHIIFNNNFHHFDSNNPRFKYIFSPITGDNQWIKYHSLL